MVPKLQMQSAAIHPSKASSLQMFLRKARLGLSRSVRKAEWEYVVWMRLVSGYSLAK
jgi:hypothetical protein